MNEESENRLVVIDYGMGNIKSILNMLRKLGISALPSTHPNDLLKADRLILPGVGSFDAGMRNLRDKGYLNILNHQVIENRVPILGICLGMQLFGLHSEEGVAPGLGWIEADSIRFHFGPGDTQLKVPHMGWSPVRLCRYSSLLPCPDSDTRFYFVHSYHVVCHNPEDVLMVSHHGLEFTSALCHKNIFGTQFHPEKSHRHGLDLFRNFLKWHPN